MSDFTCRFAGVLAPLALSPVSVNFDAAMAASMLAVVVRPSQRSVYTQLVTPEHVGPDAKAEAAEPLTEHATNVISAHSRGSASSLKSSVSVMVNRMSPETGRVASVTDADEDQVVVVSALVVVATILTAGGVTSDVTVKVAGVLAKFWLLPVASVKPPAATPIVISPLVDKAEQTIVSLQGTLLSALQSVGVCVKEDASQPVLVEMADHGTGVALKPTTSATVSVNVIVVPDVTSAVLVAEML